MKIKSLIAAIIFPVASFAQQVEPPKQVEKKPETFEQYFVKNADSVTEWVKDFSVKAGNIAGKTTDFAAEQTPLFIKEYIHWQIGVNILNILYFILLPIPFIVLAVKFFKRIKGWDDRTYNKDETKAFSSNNVFFLIFGIIGTVMFFVSIGNILEPVRDAAKAILAPRVVVVEKIASLVSK